METWQILVVLGVMFLVGIWGMRRDVGAGMRGGYRRYIILFFLGVVGVGAVFAALGQPVVAGSLWGIIALLVLPHRWLVGIIFLPLRVLGALIPKRGGGSRGNSTEDQLARAIALLLLALIACAAAFYVSGALDAIIGG